MGVACRTYYSVYYKKVTATDDFAKVTDHHRFSSVVMLSQAVLDGHRL